MFEKFIHIFKLKFSSDRVFGLDLLRCIAILLVLIGHSRGYLPSSIQNFINLFLVDGVAIFFVLSGFLIGKIMITSFQNTITHKNILNFWTRRWLRTIPNYYLILSILVIINLIKGGGIELHEWAKYYLFLQNVYIPIGDFFPESWSLTIEEWFYTIIPILLISSFILFNKKISLKKNLLFVIIIVISSVFLYRTIQYFSLETKNYYVYDRYFLRQMLTRIDAIMFGVLGAWLNYYYPDLFYKRKKLLFWTGVSIIILSHNFEGRKDPFLYILSFTATSTSVLFMLPMMNSWKNSNSILKVPIIYCSLISYSMYLVNLSLVGELLIFFNGKALFLKFILFWFFTIFISILLYKYFEVPIIKWRDKITKK